MQALAPNDSGTAGDNITNDTTPTLTGTTQAGSAVSVVVNGLTYTTTADASGNWSITTGTLADGNYTPVISITDTAGNLSSSTGTPFTIDASAPAANGALQAIAPNDTGTLGDHITSDTTPTLTGSTQAGAQVSVLVNGATYTTTADASGNWSITTATLSDATYTPVITVTDTAGNTSTASGTAFTVDAATPAATGALQATAPNDSGTPGDNITSDTTPTIAGTTQAGSLVSVLINGVTYTTTADASGNWAITTAGLADGVYTPVITTTDPAGNSATGNGTAFTIDASLPLVNGALQALAPNDSAALGDNITSTSTPTLTGSTQAGSTVVVLVNGVTYTTSADVSGNWTVTTASLADGNYTPVITVTDIAGNAATSNGTAFTIDSLAPALDGALSVIAPNDSGTLGDNITSDSTPAISGSTQPGSAVSVLIAGQTYTHDGGRLRQLEHHHGRARRWHLYPGHHDYGPRRQQQHRQWHGIHSGHHSARGHGRLDRRSPERFGHTRRQSDQRQHARHRRHQSARLDRLGGDQWRHLRHHRERLRQLEHHNVCAGRWFLHAGHHRDRSGGQHGHCQWHGLCR